MSIFEQANNIETMKNTVIEIFGFESKKTIDFFFKAEVADYYDLVDYFYNLTERYGVVA